MSSRGEEEEDDDEEEEDDPKGDEKESKHQDSRSRSRCVRCALEACGSIGRYKLAAYNERLAAIDGTLEVDYTVRLTS